MVLDSPPASVSSILAQAQLATFTESDEFIKEPLLKRPFDIALAVVMLLMSALVWVAIAITIKIEDGGPIFYLQERWGRNQTRFQVFKFRSMVSSSDRDFGVRQAMENDQRVTRVGRFLRATGLDELPQLINILQGDMSFVGPRALSTSERNRDSTPLLYENTPGFSTRLRVRPGLTSLATVYLPKDAPSLLKFRADLLYVQRLSFWLDMQLIVQSFWISFRGKWETRNQKV